MSGFRAALDWPWIEAQFAQHHAITDAHALSDDQLFALLAALPAAS